MYLKSTLNPIFCRASSYFNIAVLNISSLGKFFDSLSWMEFGICFMTFGEWFDKYKYTYIYKQLKNYKTLGARTCDLTMTLN